MLYIFIVLYILEELYRFIEKKIKIVIIEKNIEKNPSKQT